jgi:prepilin-type N-terminal cleavage/methylation domain-containing protein
MNKQAGFTLVEISIVLVIIGLILGVTKGTGVELSQVGTEPNFFGRYL